MLKLWYFGHLMRRADSLENKDPDTGKDWGQEETGGGAVEDEMLDSIIDSVDVSLSKLGNSGGQRSLVCCSPWGHKELDMS